MSKVQKVNGWKTTDDQYFDTEAEAVEHQDWVDFVRWCAESNLAGSPARSQQIADLLWRNWKIKPRNVATSA